jgi:hypothetical protein
MRKKPLIPSAAPIWLMLALLALPSTVAAQSVYRWVDAEGRTHFGDPASAPPGAKQVPLRTPMGQAPAAAHTGPSTSDEACAQAQERLATYQSAERIVETDSLGEQREYSPEARERLIALTELEAQRICSGEPEPAPDAP